MDSSRFERLSPKVPYQSATQSAPKPPQHLSPLVRKGEMLGTLGIGCPDTTEKEALVDDRILCTACLNLNFAGHCGA
jgi:hypothetical protein